MARTKKTAAPKEKKAKVEKVIENTVTDEVIETQTVVEEPQAEPEVSVLDEFVEAAKQMAENPDEAAKVTEEANQIKEEEKAERERIKEESTVMERALAELESMDAISETFELPVNGTVSVNVTEEANTDVTSAAVEGEPCVVLPNIQEKPTEEPKKPVDKFKDVKAVVQKKRRTTTDEIYGYSWMGMSID